MSTQISFTMLRSAVRKASTLPLSRQALKACIIGQTLQCSVLANTATPHTFRSFSSGGNSSNDDYVHAATMHGIPEPLPAVALDYVDDDDDEHYDFGVTRAVKQNPETCSSAGGRITTTKVLACEKVGWWRNEWRRAPHVSKVRYRRHVSSRGL